MRSKLGSRSNLIAMGIVSIVATDVSGAVGDEGLGYAHVGALAIAALVTISRHWRDTQVAKHAPDVLPVYAESEGLMLDGEEADDRAGEMER